MSKIKMIVYGLIAGGILFAMVKSGFFKELGSAFGG